MCAAELQNCKISKIGFWCSEKISKYHLRQVRVVFLQWLPWILRMGRPGEKITRFGNHIIPNSKYFIPCIECTNPNSKYFLPLPNKSQMHKFIISPQIRKSKCYHLDGMTIAIMQIMIMFITRKSIMMQNKMKELEEKEKSSKTCLANILDLGESGRPCSR